MDSVPAAGLSACRPEKRARGSAALPRVCLPLLPSGPDGVHKLGLRWAWPTRIGGDERIRTADPLVANEVLSQLSYIPMHECEMRARTTGHAIRQVARILAAGGLGST